MAGAGPLNKKDAMAEPKPEHASVPEAGSLSDEGTAAGWDAAVVSLKEKWKGVSIQNQPDFDTLP